MPYENHGIYRVLVDDDGRWVSKMKIIAPLGVEFPLADESVVLLAVYPNDIWIDDYVGVPYAEAAILVNGGGS